MTASVQVFGCRHDKAIHALRRPGSHEVGDKRRKLVEAIIRILTLDDDGGTLDPAKLTKLVHKSVVGAEVAQGENAF